VTNVNFASTIPAIFNLQVTMGDHFEKKEADKI